MRSTASSSRPTTRWSRSTRRAAAGRTWPWPSVWKSTSVEQAIASMARSRRERAVKDFHTGGRRHALDDAVSQPRPEVLTVRKSNVRVSKPETPRARTPSTLALRRGGQNSK